MGRKFRCPKCGEKFISPFDKALKNQDEEEEEYLECPECLVQLITQRHYRYKYEK